MSRASNLAGFVSAIYPSDNLSVGFLTARNLNVTGIATFGTLDVSSVQYANRAGIATYATTAGIATYAPTSGIATYAATAGVATVGGIGIQSGGSQIGTGVTIINFVGAGNSIRAVGDTVEISIAGSGGGGGGGGGTGFSTTGIATVRGIANADNIIESIALDDYYGTGTNYAMIGPITVTGAGTTITVGAGVSYVII